MIHFSQHCCTIPSADYSIFHAFILGYFDHEIFAVAKGACISRFSHTQRTHGLWVEWNAASHSSFFFSSGEIANFYKKFGSCSFYSTIISLAISKKNQIQNLQINLILQSPWKNISLSLYSCVCACV